MLLFVSYSACFFQPTVVVWRNYYSTLIKLLFGLFTQLNFLKKQFKFNSWGNTQLTIILAPNNKTVTYPFSQTVHNFSITIIDLISAQFFQNDLSGWLGRAMVLGSFKCRGVLLLLWHMVRQGPAVLAAGAVRVVCFFFNVFSSHLSYLPFLMPYLFGDGWTY